MDPSSEPESSQWRPLSAIDRRVLGVLVEKAKTVPASYPMTVNAICTGANQKNNRFPEMHLEPDQVQESLDRLREMGALSEVQGEGRVPKYRHHLYKWLGVEKVELAVMGELLLRGAQTVGELRGRAARMEPIADLAALKPVLDALTQKGLVIPLSPEGRGQVVAHALYQPQELDRVRAESSAAGAAVNSGEDAPTRSRTGATSGASAAETADLRAEVAQLRQDLNALRGEVEQLRSQLT
jgi:uncharacterized protein YceH (UPF0502 family)